MFAHLFTKSKPATASASPQPAIADGDGWEDLAANSSRAKSDLEELVVFVPRPHRSTAATAMDQLLFMLQAHDAKLRSKKAQATDEQKRAEYARLREELRSIGHGANRLKARVKKLVREIDAADGQGRDDFETEP